MENLRNLALKNGQIYYFTGEPCKNGHISKRYTKTGICKICHSIAQKESKFRKKNGQVKLTLSVHPEDVAILRQTAEALAASRA